MKAAGMVAMILGLCAASCARLPVPSVQASLPTATIYQRATNQFAQADFFKPAELRTNEPAFTFAPLILQEVDSSANRAFHPDGFGTLSLSNGFWVLDHSRPSVYWHADTVTLSGKAHPRFAYLWFYPGAKADAGSASDLPAAHQGGGGLSVQGVRLTLDDAGRPVIWEVLTDTFGTRVIFVSQSLEAAAAARFGKALPGRRYAIERSMTEAPNVVVARVIDDGPVAMGPIVYLDAGTRTVSAVICRCMPAQVKALRTTATYELLPLPAIPGDLVPLPTDAQPDLRPRSGPSDTAVGDRLEHCLRLPFF